MSEAGPSIPQSVAPMARTEALPINPPAVKTETLSPSTSPETGLFGSKVTVTSETPAKPPKTEGNPSPIQPENQPVAGQNQRAENQSSASPNREKPEDKPHNLYEIMGIGKDATPEEIKRAFREQAMNCHPDRNPNNPDAEEKMKDLNQAWSVLIDPDKRMAYDRAEDIGRVVSAAEAASNIMPAGAKEAFVNTACREVTAMSPDGQPKSLSELSPDQLESLAPSIIAATAEQMINSFSVKNPDSEINLSTILSSPESTALRALMEAGIKMETGSKKEGYLMALLVMLMAIISAIQVFQKAAAHEDWGEAMENVGEFSIIAGTMLVDLKGSLDIKDAISRALHHRRPKATGPAPDKPDLSEPVFQPRPSQENKPQTVVSPKPEQNQVPPAPQTPAIIETPLRPEPAETPPPPPELTANAVTHPETPSQKPQPEDETAPSVNAENPDASEIPPEITENTDTEFVHPQAPVQNEVQVTTPAAIPDIEPSHIEPAVAVTGPNTSAPIPAPPIFTPAPTSVPVPVPTPV